MSEIRQLTNAASNSAFGKPLSQKIEQADGRAAELAAKQLSVLAVEIEPMLAEEAKKRQREHGGTAPGKSKTLSEKIHQVDKGKAAAQAAKQLKVNERYVYDTKKIKARSPKPFVLGSPPYTGIFCPKKETSHTRKVHPVSECRAENFQLSDHSFLERMPIGRPRSPLHFPDLPAKKGFASTI